MGWNIRLLNDKGEPVQVPRHMEGSIHTIFAGEQYADVSITYNYGKIIEGVLPLGMKSLHGCTAIHTTKTLRRAVDKLGIERDQDYWKATPGNVGAALQLLLSWALLHPRAIWEVT